MMKTLKFPLIVFAIIPLFLLLTGCPVSTSYPLGKQGEVNIDKSLIGTWVNDSADTEAKKVKVEKADETSYNITVEEKGTMFMADAEFFKGWLAKLEDRTFLVLQQIKENELQNTFYVYHLKVEKGKLTTNDITLKVGGTDAVTSIEAYRDEVKASMSKEGFLAGEIVWKKQ